MKSDLEKLQGCWNITELEVEGQKTDAMGGQIVIRGDRFETVNMGADYGGMMSLDESSSPRSLDVLYDSGPHQGEKSLGIYQVKGEAWKLCIGFAGRTRPAHFVTTLGSGHALETLRREKAASPVKPEAAKPDAAGEHTVLEGEWNMTSHIQNGKPMDANSVPFASRIFHGDRATLLIAGRVISKSGFRVNGNEIDYTDPGQAGIFELSGHCLKISMAERGEARPVDFSAVVGGRRTVTEWKKKAGVAAS
jgi:uncharacterized protein (TIGR03067 family)